MSGYWRFLLLVVFALGSCAAPVRVEDVEGKAVSKVTIRYMGAKTIEEARLRTHIGTTAGSVYKTDQTDNDIKSLYGSGLVNDVRVLAKPRRRGVEVIYEVTTRGRMARPLCSGNTVFSDHLLARKSGLREGQKLDHAKALAAAGKLEAYYHAHGYPQASVSVRYDGDLGTFPDTSLVFIIEEGPGSRRDASN